MLSGLNQGSFVYIFDKTDKPKLKIGEVVGITQPKFGQNGIANMVVDMKVKIDDIVTDYFNIPSNSSIVSYNGGKITISETKQGLQTEIETALENNSEADYDRGRDRDYERDDDDRYYDEERTRRSDRRRSRY